MTKKEFLNKLRKRLAFLPKSDKTERLTFYSEMIDDRIEDGVSEESAVAGIGEIDDIVKQIAEETPSAKKVKGKRPLKTWEIVLLVLGSPLWLALIITFFALLIALYATAFSVLVSVYAVNLSFAVSAVACLPETVYYFITGHTLGGVFLIGAFFLLVGLSVLAFFACKKTTKGVAWLYKKTFSVICVFFKK